MGRGPVGGVERAADVIEQALSMKAAVWSAGREGKRAKPGVCAQFVTLKDRFTTPRCRRVPPVCYIAITRFAAARGEIE
jgi:hypothetical protein